MKMGGNFLVNSLFPRGPCKRGNEGLLLSILSLRLSSATAVRQLTACMLLLLAAAAHDDASSRHNLRDYGQRISVHHHVVTSKLSFFLLLLLRGQSGTRMLLDFSSSPLKNNFISLDLEGEKIRIGVEREVGCVVISKKKTFLRFYDSGWWRLLPSPPSSTNSSLPSPLPSIQQRLRKEGGEKA